MKKMIKLISLLLVLVLPFSAMAKSDDIEQKTQVLNQLIKGFEKMCLGPSGEILENTVVVDREAIFTDGKAINCGDEARRLARMLDELNVQIKSAKAQPALVQAPGMCRIAPLESAIISNNKGLMTFAERFPDKAEQLQCQKEPASQCIKDVTCNVFRSVGFSDLLKLANKVVKSKDLSECSDLNRPNCLGEALSGVFKNLATNLEGAWALAKMGANGVKNLTIATWKKLTGVEDKTSDSALMASAQSNSSLELFKKDYVKFTKKLIADLWESTGNSIKQNFGCEKWSGSTCLEEMKSWDCATCNQRFNAICGVVGVLGGEALVAYITGGATAVAKSAAKGGAAKLAELNRVVTKAIPSLDKAQKSLKAAAKVVGKTVGKVVLVSTELGEKLLQSDIAKKIAAFSKKGTSPIFSLTAKVARSAAMKVTFKVIEGATSPVTGYMKLLEKSFNAGFTHGERAVGSVNNSLSKFSSYLSGDKVMQKADDVSVILNGKLSQEEIIIKLNDGRIPYEEIVLPDGKKALRIKLDPSCGSSGLIIQ